MKEKAKTEGDLALARSLMELHVRRYSQARLEIERLVRIGISDPKQLLTITLDTMDNKKGCFCFWIFFSIIYSINSGSLQIGPKYF